MAGLDMVKGPHWSQILTLFGHNGSISDILKERTQVQLKDKARNLKLFFLKTNSEMPFYLQAVTGELKTRAPTQAARKEAEERARMNSEEEQARIQGIMTLAGGLQNPPQARAAGGSATVVTPAQAASAAQATLTQQMGHNGTAHAQTAATHSGYPPSSLPQARTAMIATSHQALQSAQGSPRQQSHLPPQRPQPQQQQAQPQLTFPSPVMAQANIQGRSQTSTPVAQHHSSPHISPTPQPAPSVTAHSVQPQQSHYSPPPVPSYHQSSNAMMQAPTAQMVSQPPTPSALVDVHDNAAEAALLQGLQAAVAESM